MTKFAKIAAVAAVALAWTPALAAPVGVTGGSGPPAASARIVKPLTLTSAGALNFGTIVIPAGGVTADRLIRLSATTGAIAPADCGGGSAEVVCSGTTSIPTYNVRGTNNATVQILKLNSTLNGNNGGTLQLTPTGQATIQLTSSGAPGDDFTIGGDITITSATIDGLYTGFVNVQVDY